MFQCVEDETVVADDQVSSMRVLSESKRGERSPCWCCRSVGHRRGKGGMDGDKGADVGVEGGGGRMVMVMMTKRKG